MTKKIESKPVEPLQTHDLQAFIAAAVQAAVTAALSAAAKIPEVKGEAPPLLISREEFEALPLDQAAGKCVSKKDFFALTPLDEMKPEAAEQTYQRWISSGRVKESKQVKLSPDGSTPDEIAVTVECRFINHENRRRNINKRCIEETVAQGFDVRPAALKK